MFLISNERRNCRCTLSPAPLPQSSPSLYHIPTPILSHWYRLLTKGLQSLVTVFHYPHRKNNATHILVPASFKITSTEHYMNNDHHGNAQLQLVSWMLCCRVKSQMTTGMRRQHSLIMLYHALFSLMVWQG